MHPSSLWQESATLKSALEGLELKHERTLPVESASVLIDERIKELRGRRGKTLAQIQAIQHEVAPESVGAIDIHVAALNSAAKP
jgi:hypothetical protein